MQAGLTKNPYKDIFDNALNMFLDGKWKEAKKKFDEVKKHMPKDGPTEVILKYIEDQNHTKPDNWKGSRQVD